MSHPRGNAVARAAVYVGLIGTSLYLWWEFSQFVLWVAAAI